MTSTIHGDDSDVGDIVNYDASDMFGMLLPDSYAKMADVDDQNGQNRYQHLKVVTKSFRLQHPSPTSI